MRVAAGAEAKTERCASATLRGAQPARAGTRAQGRVSPSDAGGRNFRVVRRRTGEKPSPGCAEQVSAGPWVGGRERGLVTARARRAGPTIS